MDLQLNDVVRMRKPHPCGSDLWRVVRVGADIKIKCLGCARVVMLDRVLFEKRVKARVARAPETEGEPQ